MSLSEVVVDRFSDSDTEQVENLLAILRADPCPPYMLRDGGTERGAPLDYLRVGQCGPVWALGNIHWRERAL